MEVMNLNRHVSVLLDEAIQNLNLNSKSIVVDGTLGYAGHSSEILKKIKSGSLFAFDQDSEAIKYSTDRLSSIGTNFTIIKANFKNMEEKLNELNVYKVDGILLDLGVSSPELDDDYRGFSYHKDSRLDMRMDTESELDAYYVVNNYDEKRLKDIFYRYGESKFASSIAKNIVRYRKDKNIETTLELVEIIKNSVPMKFRIKKHPAKQIFQAIRIEVNDELNVLKKVLVDSTNLLDVGGRLVVITFHSLEDRIVKKYFKDITEEDDLVRGMPNVDPSLLPDFRLVNRKVILPSEEEIENNKRSRSAKMRVLERIK